MFDPSFMIKCIFSPFYGSFGYLMKTKDFSEFYYPFIFGIKTNKMINPNKAGNGNKGLFRNRSVLKVDCRFF